MEYADLGDLGVVADAYARGYKTKKVALAGARAERLLEMKAFSCSEEQRADSSANSSTRRAADIPASDLHVKMKAFSGDDQQREEYLWRTEGP